MCFAYHEKRRYGAFLSLGLVLARVSNGQVVRNECKLVIREKELRSLFSEVKFCAGSHVTWKGACNIRP
jgi:hypothetical protein